MVRGCVAEAILAASPWADLWQPGHFGRTDGGPGVSVSEPRRCAAATLMARKGKSGELLVAAAAFGVELPRRPAWAAGGDLTFIWTGPEQWMVRGLARFTDIEADLAGLAGSGVLVDQSHARAVLTLAGGSARDTLAKGFEVDLHPRAFKPGDAAVTVAAGISAILWQIDDRPTYGIAVPRSMAGSFWHWFTASAAQYGYTVEP